MIVFDLEWTAWEGSAARGWSGPGEYREIVQIGAVRLSPALHEAASFEIVVRPRLNPLLSDYFVALTGITQDRVDAEGVDIAEALARFAAFAGSAGPLLSNGADGAVIAANEALFGLAPAIDAKRFVDIRPLLARVLDIERPDSGLLPALLGLETAGRGHDALADARAVAAALRRLAAQRRLDPSDLQSNSKAFL